MRGLLTGAHDRDPRLAAAMRARFRPLVRGALAWIQSHRAYRRAARRLLARRIIVVELDRATRRAFIAVIAGKPSVPDREAGTGTSRSIVWGAYVLGRPAGTIALVCNPADAERLPGCWTGGLYVRPLYRGLGVAERLKTAAVERARLLGADAVYAWTSPDNWRALGMSAKVGSLVVSDPLLEEQCRALTGSEQLVLRLDLTATGDRGPTAGSCE